jgi:ABC-type transport system substrate-binding protein
MGLGDAVIVAPRSADGNKEKPVGTGPFKFDSWAKGSAIKLTKSDSYWGAPAALDKVEFRVIPTQPPPCQPFSQAMCRLFRTPRSATLGRN